MDVNELGEDESIGKVTIDSVPRGKDFHEAYMDEFGKVTVGARDAKPTSRLSEIHSLKAIIKGLESQLDQEISYFNKYQKAERRIMELEEKIKDLEKTYREDREAYYKKLCIEMSKKCEWRYLATKKGENVLSTGLDETMEKLQLAQSEIIRLSDRLEDAMGLLRRSEERVEVLNARKTELEGEVESLKIKIRRKDAELVSCHSRNMG